MFRFKSLFYFVSAFLGIIFILLLGSAFAADSPKSHLKPGHDGRVQAAIPDGFAGIPWGASKAQIIKTMNERGYHQITGAKPDQLHFKGEFAGVPCQLNFDMIVDSFHTGEASGCARSPHPDEPQRIFTRFVDMLSKEYGPPHKRRSEPGRDISGKVIPWVCAEWDFVDKISSDKYSIYVIYSVTWFADTKEVNQYVVNVVYSADTLKYRLIDKIKPVPGPVID